MIYSRENIKIGIELKRVSKFNGYYFFIKRFIFWIVLKRYYIWLIRKGG